MPTKSNKETALALFTCIMKGDWAKVNELLADDFQYTGDSQPAIGKNEYIYFMKEILCKGFTNVDMHFHRVIAEGYANEKLSVGSLPYGLLKFLGLFIPQMRFLSKLMGVMLNNVETFESQKTWDKLGKPALVMTTFTKNLT